MRRLYFPIFILLTSCHLEIPGTAPAEASDAEDERETSPIAVDPVSAPSPVWNDQPSSSVGDAGASGPVQRREPISAYDGAALDAVDSGPIALSSDASTMTVGAGSSAFVLTSPAFVNGARLPEQFSCKGADVSPPLSWMNPPPDTQTFALVLTSSTAQRPSPTVEWIVWSIPADSRALPEGIAAGHEPSNLPVVRQDALSELQRAAGLGNADDLLSVTAGSVLGLPTPLDLVRRPQYHGPCDAAAVSYQFNLFALDATASREWGAFVSIEAVAEWLKTPQGVLAQARLEVVYP